MVTCNICMENKKLEELERSFRYVCKECWKKMRITIDGIEINKEQVY